MKIEIHPEAEANFNLKAEELLLLITPHVEKEPRDTFPSETYVEHTINEKDIIGKMGHSLVNFKGDEIAKFFEYNGKTFGLEENAYKQFFKLCEAIQRTPSLSDTMSLKSIENVTFEWIESRYKGEINTPLLSYAIPHLESKIQEIEIVVPIFSLMIQSGFPVGRVKFIPITRALFDEWYSKTTTGRPEEVKARYTEFLQKERKKIQGLAAGTLKLIADKDRAGQIALDETERMLNLFRFFEPVNLHPGLISHCAILGKQNQQTTKYYVFENNILIGSTSSILDKGYYPWKVENGFIAAIQHSGLNTINEILANKEKTAFHKTILDTLQIYSRCSLSSDYSDKLLYLLVTLESLLLKDSTEPIQQNVGERMAFALSQNPNERKKIVRNFKQVYGLRSKFLHHGNDIESEHVDTLQEFMFNVWNFLRMVILNANKFQTREQMIDTFENIKFS